MGIATFKPDALPCSLGRARVDSAADRSCRPLVDFYRRERRQSPLCRLQANWRILVTGGTFWRLGQPWNTTSCFLNGRTCSSSVPTGRNEIFILIWERGAGETQASGSSSCAAASAAVRLGLVRSPVTVKMPGGMLNIDVAPDFSLTMKGPVAEVARGTLSPSFIRGLK